MTSAKRTRIDLIAGGSPSSGAASLSANGRRRAAPPDGARAAGVCVAACPEAGHSVRCRREQALLLDVDGLRWLVTDHDGLATLVTEVDIVVTEGSYARRVRHGWTNVGHGLDIDGVVVGPGAFGD